MGCDVTTGADRVLAMAADALAGCVDFAVGDGADDLADGSSAVKPTDSVALMGVFGGVDAGHEVRARVCAAAESSRNLKMS
jgi:hypothetical protein